MANSPIQPGDFNEELLSGYLDGELSSEEQAQVERLVQQDPQAQQLLEDLEQIRHCLQELPEKQPPAEARQRVLDKINSGNLADNGDLPRPAVRRTLPTTAIVSWLVATAAGIALLFIIPPLLQDSNQVALNRGAPTDSSAPDESNESGIPSSDLAGGEGTEEDYPFPAMMFAESEEYFSEQIPVVYINIPADEIEHIDEILVANGIRVIDPSVLSETLRANKQNEGSSELEMLARKLESNDDAALGASLASEEPSLADRPADGERQKGRYVQHSATLREGSPEELEIAWEQISQYKNIEVVQQAGPQLRGLKYDTNAFRDQSPDATGPPTEGALDKTIAKDVPQPAAGGESGGKAGLGASSQSLGQRRETKDAQEADKKRVSADPAATRNSGNKPKTIIIQLIIQVEE